MGKAKERLKESPHMGYYLGKYLTKEDKEGSREKGGRCVKEKGRGGKKTSRLRVLVSVIRPLGSLFELGTSHVRREN